MDNIVLVGMPGVGKSTIGVVLAKILGMCFLDTDLVIQERTGMLLCDLIDRYGVAGFLAIENTIVAGVQASSTVIATGGSVVYGAEATARLRSLGRVVYLRLGFDELERRLRDISHRGVVIRHGQTLRELFDERTPLYERCADVVVDEISGDAEATIARVIRALERSECNG